MREFDKKLQLELILAGIKTERERQVKLWGDDFDDKNTANDWAAYVSKYVNEGAYSGRQDKYTPERFREHLLKAATLCVAAVEAIDRNGDCAPRHYEGLPGAGAKDIENRNRY